MKILEIELHEAKINHSRVDVSYTISDMETNADINQQISKSELVKFICEKDMNVYCSDAVLGDYSALDADTYLTGNLNEVVTAYLTENLS